MRLRAATAADHDAYLRLLPELGVDDPPPSREKFVAELVPSATIAENADGMVLGWFHAQTLSDTFYVRNVVVNPSARRRGVARALMNAAADRAVAAGCTRWCLNVKRTNRAAIALYESFGMAREFGSVALRVLWSDVASASASGASGSTCTSRGLEPEDDGRVAAVFALPGGQLARLRSLGRVLTLLEEDGEVVGLASFDPSFPGAYPFRVARPGLAIVLLSALRPHARPAQERLNVMVEGQPSVAEALVALGAEVAAEIDHMTGALPTRRARPFSSG